MMAEGEQAIREISRDDLVNKFQHGEPFVLVDVLSHEHFSRVHLPGAINVPVNVLRDLAPLLFGKHDQLIVYCVNFECSASPTAVRILTQLGFTNVLDFAGGIRDWIEGGQPVIRGEEASSGQQAA
ncbi:MAG: rhodanese-like domain-containing protein [Armatimonadota bacterium]